MSDTLDERAHNLAKDNVRLAQWFAKKHYSANPTRAPIEEFVSWAMHGLIKAAQKFDESKKIKFATFAGHKIYFEIQSGLRSRAEAMNKYDSFEIATAHDRMQFADDSCYEVGDIVDQAEISEAIHEALKILPKIEREIIELVDFRGLEQQEIAPIYQRSASWVSHKRKDALKKLRRYLKSWYYNRR